jgi:hypothetical protein
VHAQPPYAAKGQRNQRNERDGIFRRGGSQLILDVKENAGKYAGAFEVALQLP